MRSSPAVSSRLAKVAWLSLWLVGAACVPHAQEESIGALKSRLSQYEASWNKRDLGSVWRLMSPRLRRGNEDDLTKFEESVRRSDVWVGSIRVHEVRVSGPGLKSGNPWSTTPLLVRRSERMLKSRYGC